MVQRLNIIIINNILSMLISNDWRLVQRLTSSMLLVLTFNDYNFSPETMQVLRAMADVEHFGGHTHWNQWKGVVTNFFVENGKLM